MGLIWEGWGRDGGGMGGGNGGKGRIPLYVNSHSSCLVVRVTTARGGDV